MRAFLLATTVFAFAAIPSQSVSAQSMSPSFRGFRIEGNIGGDRFESQGTHNDRLGYGATVGFDGMIGDKIVIGPEGSYWRARNGNGNCADDGAGNSLCSSSYDEYGAAVRVGYLVTPRILIFGKGGYVHNRQRQVYGSDSGFLYLDGQVVGPGYTYVTHRGTDGYQAGGGVEFSLTNMFYVDGQYVYSRYSDDTARQRAMFGVGIRF